MFKIDNIHPGWSFSVDNYCTFWVKCGHLAPYFSSFISFRKSIWFYKTPRPASFQCTDRKTTGNTGKQNTVLWRGNHTELCNKGMTCKSEWYLWSGSSHMALARLWQGLKPCHVTSLDYPPPLRAVVRIYWQIRRQHILEDCWGWIKSQAPQEWLMRGSCWIL